MERFKMSLVKPVLSENVITLDTAVSPGSAVTVTGNIYRYMSE